MCVCVCVMLCLWGSRWVFLCGCMACDKCAKEHRREGGRAQKEIDGVFVWLCCMSVCAVAWLSDKCAGMAERGRDTVCVCVWLWLC